MVLQLLSCVSQLPFLLIGGKKIRVLRTQTLLYQGRKDLIARPRATQHQLAKHSHHLPWQGWWKQFAEMVSHRPQWAMWGEMQAGSKRGATPLPSLQLPGAKLSFALRATPNISGPVFLFVREHQSHLAVLTFALCYVCWPIKISSGVSRAGNAVILSKLRLVCPNCTANTSVSCGVVKMARRILNWTVIKYGSWLKKRQ